MSLHPTWGLKQWTAYIKEKEIPILVSTKMRMEQLVSAEGMELIPNTIAAIALTDPFLALRLLRKADRKRSHTGLSSDITTLLTCVMLLGTRDIIRDVLTAPECPTIDGLQNCALRAATGAHIAHAWASYRADISPTEVAMAALLSDLGELMLWLYSPELPDNAIKCLMSGQATRNKEAQVQTAGFGFKELSIELAKTWNLPISIKQLMASSENNRSKLAKCAINTARHLAATNGLIAVPDDIIDAHQLCSSAKVTELLIPLHLNKEKLEYILSKIVV